jgi:hypothetical protein
MMTQHNFDDKTVRKEADRLHKIRRLNARPMTEEELEIATAYASWKYKKQKEKIRPS